MTKTYTKEDIPKIGYGRLTWIGATGFSVFVCLTMILTFWVAINVGSVLRGNAKSLNNQNISMKRLEESLQHSRAIQERQIQFAPVIQKMAVDISKIKDDLHHVKERFQELKK